MEVAVNVMKRLLTFSYMIMILALMHLILPGQCVQAADEPIPEQGWMEWGDNYYPLKPVRGGIIRVASPVYIGAMNPNHFPVLDWITMSYMYEKLINLDGNFKPTVPWLAETWEQIDDVTVLMKLRQGVMFHDGSPFNAEALKYQFDWIMDKKNSAWTRSWVEPLKSVEVVDEYTVKWHFKRPWGGLFGHHGQCPRIRGFGKGSKG